MNQVKRANVVGLQRFSKTTIEGYLPIYANNRFTRVNLKATVNNMKNLHGFCVCNSLPASRIAKLQEATTY